MYNKLSSLYRVDAIQASEQRLLQAATYQVTELLQRAGQAAWETLYAHWPNCKELTVCCGCGNNAGDGFVLAQLAKKHGCEVRVWAIEDLANLAPHIVREAVACQALGIEIEPYQGQSVLSTDLIVDALLGTGLNRPLDGRYLQLVQAINATSAQVFALDTPTGIDADTGQVLACAVRADVTLSFILPKRGLFTDAALAHTGRVLWHDLEIAMADLEPIQPVARLINTKVLRQRLDPRKRHAHKGDFGHVLVIGGDYGMGGAVRMAAEAAARVGAGLVSVATRPEHINIVTGNRPELMCYAVPDADTLKPLLARATVVVIGPGLGQSDWSQALFDCAITSSNLKVIDADGLNLLSKQQRRLENTVLTPHPGEAKRLLGDLFAAGMDRFSMAQKLQQQYGGVVVLKGAGTIIDYASAEPQGVCVLGNPGMASGGMGDVLSGVIGGLLAQGINLNDAASLAVYIHAVAGDMAAQKGGERGMMASDLFNYLRLLANPTTLDDDHCS